MGRGESDDLTAAQIMYPLMQCADIFFLKVSMLFVCVFCPLLQRSSVQVDTVVQMMHLLMQCADIFFLKLSVCLLLSFYYSIFAS
jgi:hypothetical protein